MAFSKLSIANPSPQRLPGPTLLHDLVPQESKDGYAAIEYTHQNGTTSRLEYSELHSRADALAARIRSVLDGLHVESTRTIIPIIIPQCPELYVSQLASLKAGGAFCPIVLDVPEERLRFMLRDTDARVLLTTLEARASLPHLEAVQIIVVDEKPMRSPAPATSMITIRLEDAAYVMYTSGSTGQPKGVVLSHSAATQALLAHDRNIPQFERFLQFASPTFDVSVFEIFFPWFRHRTLISCDRRRLLNDLPAVIHSLGVDACELTPSVAGSLLRRRKHVPNLKVLLTIGEMLKPAVVEEFGGDLGQPSLLHGMYGPTEATIHCTVQRSFAKNMTCNVIGVPLDTVSAFVVRPADPDRDPPGSVLEILPLGEEGELAIGGHQLADGYLNRDEQTRSVFVRHPEFGMLYRTGDRVKMSQDRVLQCFGRISSGQVKLRGQRVELGEIEHAAAKTPACQDTAVEVISGNAVVFCARENQSLTRSSVLETCQRWLPTFMIPGDVVLLDALPYLPSGKCDRKALRTQYQTKNAEVASPQMNAETSKIAQVVGLVLTADIGPDTILPALGLDSLSSIRIASELQRNGLGRFDATDILMARTLADIAEQSRRSNAPNARTTRTASVGPSNERVLIGETLRLLPKDMHEELEDVFPCTPVQAAMLAETRKNPEAYCNWAKLYVDVSCDSATFEEALRQVCDLHPLLRSGFVSSASLRYQYCMVIWKRILPVQIVCTSDFDYEFRIEEESGLLRPCQFQMTQHADGYTILLKIHHALFDQWSLDVFRRDLSTILKCQKCPRTNYFKAVSEYYVAMSDVTESTESLDFWRDHLRHATFTSLPLMRGTAVPDRMQRSEWYETTLTTSWIKDKSRQMGINMPAVFQAALSYILSSYTGSADITFGSVFSGRTIPVADVESVFGPCLATLPLRIDCTTVTSLRDLVTAISQQNRSLQRRAFTSLTTIKRAAGVSPGSALFDTLFVWQESTIEGCDNCIQLVDTADNLESNLVLECVPDVHKNVLLRATFQERLISPDQVNVFLHQLGTIAKRILESPEDDIGSIASCLPPDMLSISNPVPKNVACTFELTTVIDQQASKNPSAAAIAFATDLDPRSPKITTMSYAELVARANQLANHFIELGIKPGNLICICMEKSVDLYIAILATLKAGAGYLPLTPQTPEARMKSVFAQADIGFCIGDQHSCSMLRDFEDVNIVNLATCDVSTRSSKAPVIEPDGSRAAYAVFTSGSTGEPKGVAVTVDNLKANLASLAELYRVPADSRMLQSCSQAFDVSVFEIFFAFYQGMCLCSATKEKMFWDFEHSIRVFGATHLSLTPTVAALVKPGNVPSVQFLVTAGEGITDKVHHIWADHGLHQGYGPSETTNICSVKMRVSTQDVLGNIGPPLSNTSAFVLEPGTGFKIAPAGAYGEFVFGGEQVFRGYIKHEELNVAKILQHPEYGRVYRSGDMGRILANGTLLITGRIDDQVKVRGNRIELGEINATIQRQSDVSDCATILLGRDGLQQKLISFCTLTTKTSSTGASLDVLESEVDIVADIFKCVESSLPEYMVPSLIVPLTSMPITTQGKLDKRALEAISKSLDGETRNRFSRSQQGSDEDGPSNSFELGMAEALADVLHVELEGISRTLSFFGLGLDSLNAIQFARRIEQKLGVRVNISDILRNPSLARLAAAIGQTSNDRANPTNLDVQAVIPAEIQHRIRERLAATENDIEAILPCTPLQQAMLSASDGQNGAVYSNTLRLKFNGDTKKLRKCWDQMNSRHSILRTAFVDIPSIDQPYAQVVFKRRPSTWYPLDTPVVSSSVHRPRTICENSYPENGVAMKKTNPPGVSLEYPVRIDHRGPDIYLIMHHAVYDGVAVSNLLAELLDLYEGKSIPPPVSFEPFLREVLAQNLEQALQFWSGHINGFNPLPFPIPEDVSTLEEATLRTSLPVRQQDLENFAARHACTILSVFQAAWTKILGCAQDSSDVCFGNVVSGRTVSVSNVERLVAPCFNTIPIRAQLDRNATNLSLIREMHKTNLDAMPYQLAGLRHIQKFSRVPSKHLFDSLLLLQSPSPEIDIQVFEEDEMSMGVPIVLELVPKNDAYELSFHYMTRIISSSLATSLIDAFMASLRSCMQYPSNAVSDLSQSDQAAIFSQLRSNEDLADLTADSAAQSPIDTAWSSGEKLVRHIFADLAHVDPSRIQRDTSLYQIGLDSLNAVRVASDLRREGYQLDAADVMQHQSPASLARHMRAMSQSSTSDAVVDLEDFDRLHRSLILERHDLNENVLECIRPATAAQSGMLAQFIQSAGKHYLNHSIYDVPAEYGVNDIQRAWTVVERRHQVLRMGFSQLEDAEFPFAMLIFQPGAYLSQVFRHDPCQDANASSTKTAEDILARVHLPIWRVSLLDSGHRPRMQLSLHHSLYDADSLHLILRDFARALRGEEIGAALDIDPVLLLHFSQAQGKRDERKAFWKQTLGDANVLKFPNLTPTVVHSFKARMVSFTSAIRDDKLGAFCRQNNTTVQALGQSVWAILLSAYVGESAVTFGTVFSSFAGSAQQSIAFPAMTTVPVPCDTDKPAMDVIHDMVAYNASVQRHRFTPLADIQRYAGSERRALFDTIFVYQKSYEGVQDSLDWHLVDGMLGVDYVASMEVEPSKDGTLKLRLTVDDSVIPEQHATLMLAQYDRILRDLVDGPGKSESTPMELMSYSAPKVHEIPTSVKLLHEIVERGARRHPQKVALEFIHSLESGGKRRESYTYERLDHYSNQVAHMISRRGIRPGNIIAVCMAKSVEASFAFVGILKAGCAFLAMDPELPGARKQFIVEDSRSKLLFATPRTYDSELKSVVEIIELTKEALAELPQTRLDIGLQSSAATSYCLYTSGTTGLPKGCELTHENAVQAMMSFQRLFASHWTEASRWLQFASYWFDVSVLEQFWSWSVGITVVGAPRDLVLEDLAGFIRQANITHIDLTPSLARLLVPQDVPSLCRHVFITGGEALKQEIIDSWGPHRTICNGYGPTEATIGVTMNPFIGPDARPSNIGPAFDNVGAYVFKPGTDELVMRGAIGELCVFGKLVGKGYLNRPDLTAKAFPYLDRYDERVYRTGDLVRLLSDGSFSFVGRADTQAKLRGQRLEIDEIDAVIKAADPSISDVASFVIKSNDGVREMLVSFISDAAIRRGDTEVIISGRSQSLVRSADAACRGKLPGYMLPTHILPIATIPLTVNNKVDTKKLKATFESMSIADLQRLKNDTFIERQMTTDENKIASILSRLLVIDQNDISHNSNVFSLGLSSVSAINFASMLKRSDYASASVISIMNNPLLDQLAVSLVKDVSAQSEQNAIKQAELAISAFSQRHRSTITRALAVDPLNVEAIAPCTPLQTGLLVESLKSSSRPYFNHFWYRVRELSAQDLKTAMQRLFETTPILRTLFVPVNEGFAQVLARRMDCPVSICRLGEEDVTKALSSRKSIWASRADADVLRPFEAVIMESAGGTWLAMHAHHAIYDGISWDLLMQRLAHLCTSRSIDEPSPEFLDVLPYGPLYERPGAKEFWKAQLHGTRFQPLSIGQGSPSHEDTSLERRLVGLRKLDDARRTLGVSHQAVFQAAFSVALQQHSPQSNTFGVVLSGRSIDFDHADQVIGPVFNTAPLRIDRLASDDWAALLRRHHQSNAEMLPYQHTALRDIKKYCGRHPSDALFDVLFVFQQQTRTEGADNMFEAIESRLPVEYPLAFEVELKTSDELSITAASQQGFADKATLQSLLDTFGFALESIATNVNQQVADVFPGVMEECEADFLGSSGHDSELNGVHDFEWTQEARLLQRNIAELVGCEPGEVTEQSAIFTLGLDSIDAVKLASRLKSAGISFPVSAILQAQTIPRMLHALQRVGGPSSRPTRLSKLVKLESKLQAVQLERGLQVSKAIERVLPTTPGQEALLVGMIRSDFRQYFNSDVLRLKPGVDLVKLKAAWQAAVDASPVLRTSFVEVLSPEVDVSFAQLVHRPEALAFTELMLSDGQDLQSYLDRARKDVQNTLAWRPPLRIAIAKTPHETLLVLSMAHAQYDGHSIALLHRDVAAAYQGSTITHPRNDEVIDIALNATSEEAFGFWRDTLAGAQDTSFNRSQDLENVVTHRAERVCSVDPERLRHSCKQLGVSPQAVAQATWALVLAHRVQQLGVVFGAVLSCRESDDSAATMFPTMNTIPVRTTLFGTGQDFVRHMQQTMNDVRPFQSTPLRAIQKACTGARNGLFDSIFIFQQQIQTESSAPSLYESVDGDSDVEYTVAVELEATTQGLVARIACKLGASEAEDLLQKFDQVLDHLLHNPLKSVINFIGEQASICEMSPFQLRSEQVSPLPALPQLSEDRAIATDNKSPHLQSIRTVLARVAKLDLEDVSIDTPIESLGIDSISAIKVAALLRAEDVKVSVSDLLKAQTPSKIAELAISAQHKLPAPPSEEIIVETLRQVDIDGLLHRAGVNADDVEEILPATAGQQYMLSMYHRSSGKLFCSTFEYFIRTERTVGQLETAWNRLVAARPILRTDFYWTETSALPLIQVISRKTHKSFFTESEKPHELLHVQLMVCLQASAKTDGFRLSLTIHHALYDAVSLPLLMRNFEAMIKHETISQPQLEFKDLIAAISTPAAQESRKSFWKQYLHGARPMHLNRPRDNATKRVELFRPSLIEGRLELNHLARAGRVTVPALFFALYAKLYPNFSVGSAQVFDVAFGVYLANRTYHPDLDNLSAPTLNLLPLLVRAPRDAKILDLARTIDADLRSIGTMENSGASLEEIRQWTGVSVDSFVNFLKLPDSAESDAGSIIVGTNTEWETDRAQVVELERSQDWQPLTQLSGMPVTEAYKHAVDVEISVKNGKVSIGLFCLEDILGIEQAEELVSAMGRELLALGKEVIPP